MANGIRYDTDMCGRYTLRTPAHVLVKQFNLPGLVELPERYNIAPTQTVVGVRASEDGSREAATFRWGLVPFWAKDPAIGNRMINARAETVATKPAYRAAFKRRRCLVLADGFYEWQKQGKAKQPFFMHMDDDGPFALAGLWERWGKDDDEAIESCTIITTEPSPLLADIHDRMPVILEESDHELWLDPDFENYEYLGSMLRPFLDERLVAEPVSSHVNNPRNDSPRCVEVQQTLF
ncbi:MAG: SOS response-associated peptidase [Pirellulales bacterium]|nr:SOS response-associated peptidase [Pirellulales bacterium]